MGEGDVVLLTNPVMKEKGTVMAEVMVALMMGTVDVRAS